MWIGLCHLSPILCGLFINRISRDSFEGMESVQGSSGSHLTFFADDLAPLASSSMMLAELQSRVKQQTLVSSSSQEGKKGGLLPLGWGLLSSSSRAVPSFLLCHSMKDGAQNV